MFRFVKTVFTQIQLINQQLEAETTTIISVFLLALNDQPVHYRNNLSSLNLVAYKDFA